LRAAIHVFETCLEPSARSRNDVTEQMSPLFRWLRMHDPETVGSEYLGSAHEGGTIIDGTRHEDVTGLSFASSSLDFILSFDVLEHVHDYERALYEFLRCLKPGGMLLMSVPFGIDRADTLVRARRLADGSVRHIQEPEYHRIPTSSDRGILCYYHFGWDMLDALSRAGASEAGVVSYYSFEAANLGPEQFFFLARRYSGGDTK
jgi:SAM-dependent methyltransferase